MRYLTTHSIILCVLLAISSGYSATYSFKPSTVKRNVKMLREYDLALTPGKKNSVYLPALMSFYGATNEQSVVRSDFEYSLDPDTVEITTDNLGMPRKYYKLTWNTPAVSNIKVRQRLNVRLMCRNKLCTKATYPYSTEVLRQWAQYLAVDPKEEINPENKGFDSICRSIGANSTSAEEVVENVCDWINDNIDFKSKTRYGSDETFKTRKGNCTAMSKLACAMLRKMGIPCDLVSGKFIEGNSGHTFIEVYFTDAGWVFYDLSNWERGFKSLDCLMTVGYSYRKRVEGHRSEWVNGYFSQEQDVATYVEPQPVRTKPIRILPKKREVLGVRVAPIEPPSSIRVRKQPLRELILNESIPPGIRDRDGAV